MLGYNQNSKRQLSNSLKAVYNSCLKENKQDPELPEAKGAEGGFEFEVESKRTFFEAMRSESAPSFIYIPTSFAMRSLILSLI